MDDNLKRKFPGSDGVPGTAPQFKKVSVSTPKKSGRVIGIMSAALEILSLSKDLEEAFKNPRFADLILRVGAYQFRAHKIILVSRSKVFERMLASNMSESKVNIVNLVDVKASTVKAMLQYMYTGRTGEMFIDQVMDLYVAADRYGLLGLKENCKNFIVKEIDEESICDVAVLGDLHCDEDLSKAAKCVLKKNPKPIFESQKWVDFAEEYPEIYSKLIESTMVDVTDGVAQSNCKSTADISFTTVFRPFQRPGIPNPSSSPSSISIPSNEYLNLQNPSIRNPRIPPIRNRQNVPIQGPENPPMQAPENPPMQAPENPPMQAPENPPIRNRQNVPIQGPENNPIALDIIRMLIQSHQNSLRQNPRNPSIAVDIMRMLIENYQNSLMQNPRNPSIALDIMRMLVENHQDFLLQNHRNPPIAMVVNPENPQIVNPETPQIVNPENPQIEDPENRQIEDPENRQIEDPENPQIEDPENPHI